MPLVIFYGQMGAGKSRAAKVFGEMSQIPFLEGDNTLKKGENLHSKKAVDEFVVRLIKDMEAGLSKNNKNLVVAQALYYKEHRDLIKKSLKDKTDEIIFVNINCNTCSHLSNLWSRSNPTWFPFYWTGFAFISKLVAYDAPKKLDGDLMIIHKNKGDEELKMLLKSLCDDVKPKIEKNKKIALDRKDSKEAKNDSKDEKPLKFSK